MRRVLLALLVLGLLCLPVKAGAVPGISAASAILMDGDSGRVLYEKEIHSRRSIASTTKLLTALVAAETLEDLSQTVTITREDTLTEGSSMYLKVGEQVTAEELLYGLLLHSGNDAALALARICSGSVEAFVGAMNRKARDLGMTESSFANPAGLDQEGHYSTAWDMALLAKACLENETVSAIAATRSITLGTRHFVNHNKLLAACPGCVGLKTGYTEDAGRTLVTAVRRGGQTLICVTLRDRNDWKDHEALYDYGFSAWPRRTLTAAGEDFGALPVTGSLVRSVPLTAAEEVAWPLGEGEAPQMELLLPAALSAPLEAEQRVGKAVWYLEGRPIGETDLVCTAEVHRDALPPLTLRERFRTLFARPDRARPLPAFSQYRYF